MQTLLSILEPYEEDVSSLLLCICIVQASLSILMLFQADRNLSYALNMPCADLAINVTVLCNRLKLFLLCTYIVKTLLSTLVPLEEDWSSLLLCRFLVQTSLSILMLFEADRNPFSALHMPCEDLAVNFTVL